MTAEQSLDAVVAELNQLLCQQMFKCTMAELPDDDARMTVIETTELAIEKWCEDRRFTATAYNQPDLVKNLLNRYLHLLTGQREQEAIRIAEALGQE